MLTAIASFILANTTDLDKVLSALLTCSFLVGVSMAGIAVGRSLGYDKRDVVNLSHCQGQSSMQTSLGNKKALAGRLTLIAVALIAALAGWLWLTMLSPWCYERPDHLAQIENRAHQVFVYGTLTLAPVRWIVMGSNGDPRPAQLEGYQRTQLDLDPASDRQVKGLLLTVSPDELKRLDRYERLGVRYQRVEVTLSNGQQAWVYRRLPESVTLSLTAKTRPPLLMSTQESTRL